MLLSLSSLWQQPQPTVVRGGLLLALSSLLETGASIVIPPGQPPPVVRRDDGGASLPLGRHVLEFGRDWDDDEIMELVAVLAEII